MRFTEKEEEGVEQYRNTNLGGGQYHAHFYLNYAWRQIYYDANRLASGEKLKILDVNKESPAHRREAGRFARFWRNVLRLELLKSHNNDYEPGVLAESILDGFGHRIPTRKELELIKGMCAPKQVPGRPSTEGNRPEVLNFAAQVVAMLDRVPDELLELAGRAKAESKPKGFPPGELVIRRTDPGALGMETLPRILLVEKMLKGELHRAKWRRPQEKVKITFMVDTSGSMMNDLPFAAAVGIKLAERALKKGNEVVMRYYSSYLGEPFHPKDAIREWEKGTQLGGGNQEGKVIPKVWDLDDPDHIIMVTDGGISGGAENQLNLREKTIHWFLTNSDQHRDLVEQKWRRSTAEIRVVKPLEKK